MDWLALHQESERIDSVARSNEFTEPPPHLISSKPYRLVLGMWKNSYLRRADTLQRGMEAAYGTGGVRRWTADLVSREELSQRLATHRIPLAIYLGHGRERGWAGYRGFRLHHLRTPAEPMGLVISLSCGTLAFGRQLLKKGYAKAFIGSDQALGIPGLTRMVGVLADEFSTPDNPPTTVEQLISRLERQVSASASVELKEVWNQLQFIGRAKTTI